MRVLAIEPYYGGSHRAFLDGWAAHSKLEFDLISFPPYKWKWRMRHSAVSAALRVRELLNAGKSWDVIFASDMLGLAEFLGLAPAELAALPRILYFHENQLQYPDSCKQERDMHFAYMNFTSALAATQVWFNTGWHRDVFLAACRSFLDRMPDYQHGAEIAKIADKSRIFPQGIYKSKIDIKNNIKFPALRLVWAARWEHDKNPEDLYALLCLLRERKFEFRVNIIGESFSNVPKVFARIQREFGGFIDNFGYQQSREEYLRVLSESDIIISTAVHEFFGISVIEGCAAGLIPLVPRRLAYPEVLGGVEEFLYEQTSEALAGRVLELAAQRGGREWQRLRVQAQELAARYYWERVAPEMDLGVRGLV